MSDLIRRLETAAEGSRELDLEIWAQIYGGPDLFQYTLSDDSVVWKDYVPGFGVSAEGCDPLPHFTTSIDAAMTLVPEGLMDRGMVFIHWLPDTKIWQVSTNRMGVGDPFINSESKTIPLALCAASLKAREADDDQA